MPPDYRGDIIFVDDSQEFSDFDTFKKQAKKWITAFPKNMVFFQYGYKSDKEWWDKLKNPPVEIANAILDIESKAGVYLRGGGEATVQFNRLKYYNVY